jgi:hypothetical protein
MFNFAKIAALIVVVNQLGGCGGCGRKRKVSDSADSQSVRSADSVERQSWHYEPEATKANKAISESDYAAISRVLAHAGIKTDSNIFAEAITGAKFAGEPIPIYVTANPMRDGGRYDFIRKRSKNNYCTRLEGRFMVGYGNDWKSVYVTIVTSEGQFDAEKCGNWKRADTNTSPQYNLVTAHQEFRDFLKGTSIDDITDGIVQNIWKHSEALIGGTNSRTIRIRAILVSAGPLK